MPRRSSVIRRESAATKAVQSGTPAGTPTSTPVETQPVERSDRYIIPWLLLFAGSGCAALIYEIVWFQLLQFVIGSSAVSLGLLLAAYMGGLCIGSVAFARFVPARLHPLRIYSAIEAGIGLFGL